MRLALPVAVAGALALGCMSNPGRRAWNVPKGKLEPSFGIHAQAQGLEPRDQAAAGVASLAYGVTDWIELGAGLEVDAFYSNGGELGEGIKPWGAARIWAKTNAWANEDSSRAVSILMTGNYHLMVPSGEVALLYGTRLSDRVELTLAPRLGLFMGPTVVPGASAAVGVLVVDWIRVMPELSVMAVPNSMRTGLRPAVQFGVSVIPEL